TGNPNRMEIAKQAIKNYISRSSENTQIGLMIYGHKGSNSQSDKVVSCGSVEVISPIGQLVSSTVDGFLSLVKPVGWTPMGLAIEQATQVFVGKEGQNNEIILLTDGEETCDTNPVQKALALKSSQYNVKVNVIGFAVDANAQSQLNQISTSGGGTFTTANNLTELDQRFNDLYENGLKLLSDLKCNSASVDAFRTCYNSTFQKVMDWVQKRKLSLYDKKISQNEYNKLEDLSTKLYAQQKEVTTKATQDVIDQFKAKQNTIK
ncbi:MAG: VWA domain-containing protein, partial [Patescibacteria group bacterium]